LATHTRKPGKRTRERLLDTATEVFAAKGFRSATTAEICRRARANIAAISYHFGGKEALYEQVWRRAVEESFLAHPPEGGVAPDAPAEQRLAGRIRALVFRVYDDRDLGRLLIMELAEPTGLVDGVRQELLGPMRARTHALVRELLGPDATEEEVQYAATSTVNQCLALRFRRFEPTALGARPTDEQIERLASSIARFTLGGLHGTRAWIEQGRP
jgi:AcrR family transcriptional regulator